MFIATVSAELPAVGAAEAVSLVIGASGGPLLASSGCLTGLGVAPSCFLRCMGPRSQCMTPYLQSSLLSGVIISHETKRKLSGQLGRRRKVRREREREILIMMRQWQSVLFQICAAL